jgi:hypothetical protein
MEVVNRCVGKEGMLVSYCPTPGIGCLSLSLSDQTIDPQNPCVVLNETMTEVKCQCNIKLNPVKANTKLRRLQTTNNEVGDDILYESGALTMGLMVYYVASEFQNTFNAAPNTFSSAEDAERVLIVMAMFISLWSIGGFFIGLMVWKQFKMQTMATSSTQSSSTIYPESCKDGFPLATTQMQAKLLHYVFSVVPTIFTSNAQTSFL